MPQALKAVTFLPSRPCASLRRLRTDHLRVRHRQTANESSERRLQRKTHLVRIEHLDLFDEFVDVVARELIVGIKQPVKVGLDGVGRELGSVMELDALFKVTVQTFASGEVSSAFSKVPAQAPSWN